MQQVSVQFCSIMPQHKQTHTNTCCFSYNFFVRGDMLPVLLQGASFGTFPTSFSFIHFSLSYGASGIIPANGIMTSMSFTTPAMVECEKKRVMTVNMYAGSLQRLGSQG
jgi:hypothetical protein